MLFVIHSEILILQIITILFCTFQGIPDCKKYRPICWKLLFNYLGNKQSLWPEQLEKQRRNYKQLIIEMVTPPGYKIKYLMLSLKIVMNLL